MIGYYIMDVKYGSSIVASDQFDGTVYHRDTGNGKDNAKWSLLPVGDPKFPNCYFISDLKHHMFLMGSKTFSQNIQHKNVILGREEEFTHAMWTLHLSQDKGFGSPVFHLLNKKHHLTLSAGGMKDGQLYNRAPGDTRSREDQWVFIEN